MESNKKSIGQLFKRPIFLLVFFTIISLLMSFSAMLVQNAGFSVKITKGVVDMDTFYQERYGGVAPEHRPFRMGIGDNKDGMLNAKMAYQLYMPKGVSKDNPVPAIALTHGYLNSKEYEEAPAIELARRGYVVFAFDQYDHGDSTWNTPGQFQFFMWSVYDASEYLYSQDYVLKDASGNGMIAVSGHSMGGFSTEVALGLDEINFLFNIKNYRMLAGGLAVGADFSMSDGVISGYSGGLYTATYNTYYSRTVGTLYGQYDEFFFDSQSDDSSVHKKDFLNDPKGKAMLGLTSDANRATSGEFYQIAPQLGNHNDPVEIPYTDKSVKYGERVIYEVSGDHPYNTWSPEATGCMIDFYNHCFDHQLLSHELQPLDAYVRVMDGSHQIWWLKEVFTCLGMIALFGMILMGLFAMNSIPVVGKWSISRNSANVGAIAMDKPRDVKTKKIKKAKEVTPKPVKPVNKTRRGIGIVLTVFTILLSAWFIPAFMDRNGLSGTTDFVSSQALIIIVTIILSLAMALAFVLGIIMIVFKATKKDFDQKKLVRPLVGSLVISALTWAMRWVITDGVTYLITKDADRWFNAPSVNTIAYWAVASGLLALIFTLIQHFYIHEDRDISHLGLKASWKNVGGSLLNAVVVAGVTCGFIWLVNVIFKTDFRVYTYAFKTVNGVAFVSSLRYLPIFFIFYLCAGIGVASATVGKKGWRADLLAIAIEAGPAILFLIYQYGMLLATGTAPFDGFALNGILVQGLVITLVVMAIWQRRSLEKTGNIWSGVFLNTIIFTFITVANTTLYLLK